MERSQVGPKQVRNILANGGHWRVFEHVPQYDRRSTVTLVFESDGVLRRVRTFPANWAELSDEDLYAVSLGI